jgi:uncharacterized membrane protein
MLLWLYNPFTATISTRGSCDSLVTVMLLATLLMLLQGQVVLPALLYGLAVHMRIFPIVYAPAVVLFLAYRQVQQQIQQKQQPKGVAAATKVSWLGTTMSLQESRLPSAPAPSRLTHYSGSTFTVMRRSLMQDMCGNLLNIVAACSPFF